MEVVFLLPWSKKQSSINLIRGGEGSLPSSFPELNPLRKALVDFFNVKLIPLTPVWRRYKNRFWEELCFWVLPPPVQKRIEERGVVLSPLFGLLKPSDNIPKYEVSWKDTFEGKSLKRFWKEHLQSIIQKLLKGKTVFDFLSSEEREIIDFPEETKRIVFEYIRKDKKVINSLPHRAYTLRYITEMEISPDNLERINFLDYKVERIEEKGNVLKVIMKSEGKYI